MKYVVDIENTTDRQEVYVESDGAVADGMSSAVTLDPADGTPVRVARIGNRVVRAVTRRGKVRGQYTLEIDGYTYVINALDERTRAIRDLTAKSAAASGPAPLKAPMPGLIVRTNVKVGDEVQAGQGLVVMEAMKMENELRSTSSGVVKSVLVEPGTAVEKGATLVELE